MSETSVVSFRVFTSLLGLARQVFVTSPARIPFFFFLNFQLSPFIEFNLN